MFSVIGPNRTLVSNAKTYEELVPILYEIESRGQYSVRFVTLQRKRSELLNMQGFHYCHYFLAKERTSIVSICMSTHLL